MNSKTQQLEKDDNVKILVHRRHVELGINILTTVFVTCRLHIESFHTNVNIWSPIVRGVKLWEMLRNIMKKATAKVKIKNCKNRKYI